jgi:hypothetical protein
VDAKVLGIVFGIFVYLNFSLRVVLLSVLVLFYTRVADRYFSFLGFKKSSGSFCIFVGDNNCNDYSV